MQSGNDFIAAAILLLMGFIFAGIPAFSFYQNYALERDGVQVEGTLLARLQGA